MTYILFYRRDIHTKPLNIQSAYGKPVRQLVSALWLRDPWGGEGVSEGGDYQGSELGPQGKVGLAHGWEMQKYL